MNPYTSMRILTVGLKVLSAKAVAAINDPEMQTARHPNLLHNADTTGPEINKKKIYF